MRRSTKEQRGGEERVVRRQCKSLFRWPICWARRHWVSKGSTSTGSHPSGECPLASGKPSIASGEAPIGGSPLARSALPSPPPPPYPPPIAAHEQREGRRRKEVGQEEKAGEEADEKEGKEER